MFDVFDVASWLVKREAMNHEKLECLLYLSYAWFYTLNGKELFSTKGFEALPIFPAEMDIFQKYHHLKNKKIRCIQGNVLPLEIQEFLESVYVTYGQVSSMALSGYLRQSSPYLKARQRQSIISRKDMEEFYASQQDDD